MKRPYRLAAGVLLEAFGLALLASPPATGKGSGDPDERAVARLEISACYGRAAGG